MIQELCASWDGFDDRFSRAESEWKVELQASLDHTVDLRVQHVRSWIDANTTKFSSNHSDIVDLYRKLETIVIDIKSSVRLCGAQCAECNLSCTLGRHHDSAHECGTDHRCVRVCEYRGASHGDSEPCGLP